MFKGTEFTLFEWSFKIILIDENYRLVKATYRPYTKGNIKVKIAFY